MASVLCSSPFLLSKTIQNPGNNHQTFVRRQKLVLNNSSGKRFSSFIAKSEADNKSDQSKKARSVVCVECEGNGAILCSQCEGNGVNSVDFFNGQFKAGAKCWLCGGRNEMLCGNCNGAGFLGGFMSTSETTDV